MSPAGRHFGFLAAVPAKRPEDVVDCAPPPDAARWIVREGRACPVRNREVFAIVSENKREVLKVKDDDDDDSNV